MAEPESPAVDQTVHAPAATDAEPVIETDPTAETGEPTGDEDPF
jgi:hypothetical protein